MVLSISAVLFLSVAVCRADQTPAGNLSESGLARVDALIGQGKIDKALALLQELAQKDAKTPGLESKFRKIYYEKRHWGEAVTHLELALKENPSDGEATQLLGLSYFMNGKLKDAIPLLEKVQSLLPHPDATASYLVGVACIQTYQYDKARVAFAHMFSIPPESSAAHLMLAKMMVRHDFNDQAVPELKKAIELDTKLPMAHFLLGELYLLGGKTELALDEFKMELDADPMMWLTYWRMGEAYTRLDKWDLAEDALKKAIWINQNFTGPYVIMGKVQLKKGNLDLAAQFLERAVEMDPSNFEAHFQLGKVYKEQGRSEDFKREFELSQKLRDVAKPKLESLR